MIKGRYVAQIVIDFDIKETGDIKPFEEIKECVVGGELTEEIRKLIHKEVMDESLGKLDVVQTYADLYEVDAAVEG